MTQEEFIEHWGADLWERLVFPVQAKARVCGCESCKARAQNANILVHDMLEAIRLLDPHRRKS